MTHLPTLITDLAMILLVAGITTILFKKLNQPLVLGYIIAGFITGPHFSLFPTVADFKNVSTWSELGVIFLMFTLGLEFSFYKLKSVGNTAFIGAAVEIFGMLFVGYITGHLLGWNHMDSLFLGGMLSMSSTTIIIKAFEDLKLKGKRFTEMVFGILIVEDIAGIVMMVLLSTVAAATADISTLELIKSILRLLFFLVLWFVMGMYLVPTFYKRAIRLMNDETLIVASIGLCLGMVVLATNMGFSSALGAFIMGSLISEAPNAEKIEHLFMPVKDLFGAVFFVSVGMLVDPALLAEYWLPIICLIIVTIIGKLIFSSSGVLLSGQNLNSSLHCGFSLAQIGEFSFIIASLGMSLGVISNFLYPIIVAVSVSTTFTTPFCIMLADPACNALQKLLPPKALTWLNRYTDKNVNSSKKDKDWQNYLQEYFTRLLIFVTLLSAVALFSTYYLEPYLDSKLPSPYSNIATGLLSFIIMAPFLRAILINRSNHPELFSVLWFKKRTNHIPLTLLIIFKIIIASAFIFFVFFNIVKLSTLFSLTATLITAYIISSSDWLMGEYLRMESRFLVNLNERHMLKHRQALKAEGKDNMFGWFDEELQLAHYKVDADSTTIGKTLIQLSIRESYGCNILQVSNNVKQNYDLPGGDFVVHEGATLLVIGTKSHFKTFNNAISNRTLGLSLLDKPKSMRDFMLENEQDNHPDKAFMPCAITIDEHSPLLGKSIKSTNIRDNWHCMVIGLERGNYTITNPNVSLVFEKNDLLWLLGKQKMINQLVRDEIL